MNLLVELNSQITALKKYLRFKNEVFVPGQLTIYLGIQEKDYIDNSYCSVSFVKGYENTNFDLNNYQGLQLFRNSFPFNYVFTDYDTLIYLEYNR